MYTPRIIGKYLHTRIAIQLCGAATLTKIIRFCPQSAHCLCETLLDLLHSYDVRAQPQLRYPKSLGPNVYQRSPFGEENPKKMRAKGVCGEICSNADRETVEFTLYVLVNADMNTYM